MPGQPGAVATELLSVWWMSGNVVIEQRIAPHAAGLAQQAGKAPVEAPEHRAHAVPRIPPPIQPALSAVTEDAASEANARQAIGAGYNWELGSRAVAAHKGFDEVTNWMDHLFHGLQDVWCENRERVFRQGVRLD